ncbi:hypothetical protein KBZ21_38965, partial [Streptomyces sp. A73]|nr:hypothetical protein [Streptomyces sp. A73]
APCLDEPDFWYPAGSIHTRAWRDNADLAKWICRERCYVRQQCPAKLRAKYETLRRQAMSERRKQPAGPQPTKNIDDMSEEEIQR